MEGLMHLIKVLDFYFYFFCHVVKVAIIDKKI
jgi:hypothetical protein